MNREFDREIDALLRRHTRAAEGFGAFENGRVGESSSAHLDADELSAFAENALPAAARSLYVAHLADCGECRRAVAGLSSSANVKVEAEGGASVGVEAPRAEESWGRRLSVLFAPRVLRYAFPLLAICLVGVIAFIALRSPRSGAEFVARKDAEQNTGTREGITQQAPAPASEGVLADNANQNSNASAAKSGAASNQSLTPEKRDGSPSEGPAVAMDPLTVNPSQTSPEADAAAPPPPPPAPAAAGRESVSVVGEVETSAKEKAVSTKPVETATRDSKTENNFAFEQGRNQQVESRAVTPRRVEIDQAPDGSRGTQRSEANNAGNRVGLPALSRQQKMENEGGGTTATRRARSAEMRANRGDDEAAEESETRSVSGHRFRRRGGVWVDVKYNATMSMTGVRRGTEGYRALVADLPELGRIAEQLEGEVVVVVKGRAYRIR